MVMEAAPSVLTKFTTKTYDTSRRHHGGGHCLPYLKWQGNMQGKRSRKSKGAAQGVHAQVPAGGPAGGPCEERLGLPWAGHRRFQTAPTESPQGMARPRSHRWWCLWENAFTKGHNAAQAERSEENKCENVKNSLAETKARGAPGTKAGASSGPRRDQDRAGGHTLNIPEYFPSSIMTKQSAILVSTKRVCEK